MKKKTRILVIDDEAANADLVQEFLTDQGYDTTTASNGRDGFDLIKQENPDLVILDLYMPDMSGIDLCTLIRNNPNLKDIPVILCSAKTIDSKLKMEGFEAGVDDFLVRPFELKELKFRIDAILRRAHIKPPTEPVASLKEPADAPLPPMPPMPPDPTDPEADPQPALSNGKSQSPFADLEDDEFDQDDEAQEKQRPLRFFSRLWALLTNPRGVFQSLDSHQDFVISLILIISTPLIASVATLANKSSFDAWMSYVSLGLANQMLVWLGTAGVLQMIAPFYGSSLSTREIMILSGLGTAPRFVSATISTLYGVIFVRNLSGGEGVFSAGLNVIPGLPNSDWVSSLSRVGLFDAWTAWITLIGFWTLCGIQTKRWNGLSFLILVISLIFGAFSTY